MGGERGTGYMQDPALSPIQSILPPLRSCDAPEGGLQRMHIARRSETFQQGVLSHTNVTPFRYSSSISWCSLDALSDLLICAREQWFEPTRKESTAHTRQTWKQVPGTELKRRGVAPLRLGDDKDDPGRNPTDVSRPAPAREEDPAGQSGARGWKKSFELSAQPSDFFLLALGGHGGAFLPSQPAHRRVISPMQFRR